MCFFESILTAKHPRSIDRGCCGLFFLFRQNKFQKVTDLAVQYRTDTGKNVRIQSGNIVVAVMVDLRTLHLRPVTQLVFTDACFFDQFIQLNADSSILLPQILNHFVEKCRIAYVVFVQGNLHFTDHICDDAQLDLIALI